MAFQPTSCIPLIRPVVFSVAMQEGFFFFSFAALTSPHLNLIEFVCTANGSPNDTLIQPVKVMNVLMPWQPSPC